MNTILPVLVLTCLTLPVCAAEPAPAAQAAEDVIYYSPNENAFVVDWLISSRHRFPFSYLGATLNYDALQATGGEKDCAPQPGVKAGTGSNWEERHFKPSGYAAGVCGFIPCPFSFTYAFSYLYCEQECKDVEMRTGSDDGLLVLLNGRIVQRVQMQRGYATDQDKAVVTLNKGWNRLLCKIDDYSGGHGLCVRFMKADGSFLTDYKVCFVRPPEGVEVRFVDGVVYETEAAKLLKDAMKLSAEKGDLASAAAKCLEVTVRHPKAQAAAEAMYQAGRFQSQAGLGEAAMQTYDQLLKTYPYSKWVEDTLMAQAGILTARKDRAASEKKFNELIADHAESSLLSEAMLQLGALQVQRQDLDAADLSYGEIRRKFPSTVEAVKALDGQADNLKARGKREEASRLYQQVIDESQKLADGKYVFFVNVQAVLKKLGESARAKLEGSGSTK